MKSVRTILLALAGLLVVAGSASAAFNPNMGWVAGPGASETYIPDGMSLAWVDMGSHTTGYNTWDLVVTVSATPTKPQNDWSNAHLEVSKTAGTIRQVTPGFGANGALAQQSQWGLTPNLEWETFAIGAPQQDDGDGPYYVIPWPAGQFGTPEVVTGAVSTTSAINIDWFDYAEEGPGTYHIYRLTVSNDFQGTYSGFICDTDNPGVGAYFAEVPEPVTMGLLAIGGMGMLLRRRRN